MLVPPGSPAAAAPVAASLPELTKVQGTKIIHNGVSYTVHLNYSNGSTTLTDENQLKRIKKILDEGMINTKHLTKVTIENGELFKYKNKLKAKHPVVTSKNSASKAPAAGAPVREPIPPQNLENIKNIWNEIIRDAKIPAAKAADPALKTTAPSPAPAGKKADDKDAKTGKAKGKSKTLKSDPSRAKPVASAAKPGDPLAKAASEPKLDADAKPDALVPKGTKPKSKSAGTKPKASKAVDSDDSSPDESSSSSPVDSENEARVSSSDDSGSRTATEDEADPQPPVNKDNDDILPGIDNNAVAKSMDDIILDGLSIGFEREEIEKKEPKAPVPAPAAPSIKTIKSNFFDCIPANEGDKKKIAESGFDLNNADPHVLVADFNGDQFFRAYYLSLINSSLNKNQMNKIIGDFASVLEKLPPEQKKDFEFHLNLFKLNLQKNPKNFEEFVAITDEAADKTLLKLIKYAARAGSSRAMESNELIKEDVQQLSNLFNHPIVSIFNDEFSDKSAKLNDYFVYGINKDKNKLFTILDFAKADKV